MSLFSFFQRRETAPVARERLQILLAHERAGRDQTDLLGVLREEILAVIAKHVKVENDNVQVTMDRGEAVSTLEIDVEIPNTVTLVTSGHRTRSPARSSKLKSVAARRRARA